jgi:hypothetical protein
MHKILYLGPNFLRRARECRRGGLANVQRTTYSSNNSNNKIANTHRECADCQERFLGGLLQLAINNTDGKNKPLQQKTDWNQLASGARRACFSQLLVGSKSVW